MLVNGKTLLIVNNIFKLYFDNFQHEYFLRCDKNLVTVFDYNRPFECILCIYVKVTRSVTKFW